MDDIKIAEVISNEMFKAHEDNSFEFAVQLFVEKTVLPKTIDSYSKENMKNYIYQFLNTAVK